MAAGPLVIGAEGVLLVKHRTHYPSSRPIDEGLELVSQLRHFPTTTLLILVGTEDQEGAEYFIKAQGLTGATVMPIAEEDRHEPSPEAQWYNIERVRSRGPIRLVITAYAEVYEHCALSHQPVLLYARRGSVGAMDNTPSWEDLNSRVSRRQDAIVEGRSEVGPG